MYQVSILIIRIKSIFNIHGSLFMYIERDPPIPSLPTERGPSTSFRSTQRFIYPKNPTVLKPVNLTLPSIRI